MVQTYAPATYTNSRNYAKKLFELAEFENTPDVCQGNPRIGVAHGSVIFL